MKKHLHLIVPFSNWIIILLLTILTLSSCSKDVPIKEKMDLDYVETDKLKINQVQTIGSHNSYRLHTNQMIFDFW